jgi:hypothetical protein
LIIKKPFPPSFLSTHPTTIIITETEIQGDLNIMDEVGSPLTLGSYNTQSILGLRVMGKINIKQTEVQGQAGYTQIAIRQVVNYQQGGKVFINRTGPVHIYQSSLRVDSMSLFSKTSNVWLDSTVFYCPISIIQSNASYVNNIYRESRIGGNVFYGNLIYSDTLNEIHETRGRRKPGTFIGTLDNFGYPNVYYGDVYFKGKVNLGMFDTSSFHGNLTIEALDGSIYQRARFAGDQTANINIGETPLRFAIIDKTSQAGLNLTAPLNISGFMRFDNGNVHSNTNNYLKFLNGATADGFGTHSYVNGSVQKEGNSAFTFPTGSASAFKPFSISAPADTSEIVEVKYNSTSAVSLTDTSQRVLGLHAIGNCEVWEVNQVVGNSLVTVAPAWEEPCLDESIYITNTQNVQVARWDGVVWQNEGNGGYQSGMISSSNATMPSGLFTFATPRRAINIPEPPQPPSMVIFPNPVRQILNINVDQGFRQGIIIDAIGRTVSTHYIQTGVNAIDVRSLPSGVYFLKLISGHTQKVFSWIKM